MPLLDAWNRLRKPGSEVTVGRSIYLVPGVLRYELRVGWKGTVRMYRLGRVQLLPHTNDDFHRVLALLGPDSHLQY
jgi:hypothetical protein